MIELNSRSEPGSGHFELSVCKKLANSNRKGFVSPCDLWSPLQVRHFDLELNSNEKYCSEASDLHVCKFLGDSNRKGFSISSVRGPFVTKIECSHFSFLQCERFREFQ